MLRYRDRKKRRSYIYILGAVALLFLAMGISKETKDNPGRVFTKTKQIRMDYVPVTDYFSEEENISLDELKKEVQSGNAFVEKGEKENLKDLIGEGEEYVNQPLTDKIAIVKWSSVKPGQKSLAVNGKYLWEKPKEYPLFAIVNGGEQFNPSKVTKITAIGDVMLSRHVNKQIQKNGYDYPWKKTNKIADADITFANLEVPLSDLVSPPSQGMSFIAPEKNINQLKSVGIDIVSVANNHSSNFGWKVFEDNLNNLNTANLNPCGGGLNDKEARTPKIIEKNGIKFAFLCYNSITGGLRAKETTSGMATIEIEPWYRDNKTDIEKVINDIKAAKKISDVVIVSPHWGVEYKLNPNGSQKEVAKEMVEAGADLILGTHPHVVQGLEIINGKYCTYSLGNFIFDQEWSKETKEGVVLESYFYGKKQVAANLLPLRIENYSQPFFLGQLGRDIINRIKSASIGF